MKALVLDESLEMSPDLHRLLRARGVDAAFACSPYELLLAEADQAQADLRIINLGPAVTPWELARQLAASPFQGPALVFYDDGSAPGIEHLAALDGVTCLPRPRAAAELEAALDEALGRARAARAGAEPGRGRLTLPDIVGRSPQIADVFTRVEKVAPGNANVLIMGESGTGKELIARAIHENSPRRDRPLVTLDCTAVPEGLMESHLFGHLRGSFTGAVENRDGVFTLAHTGTLFIDEISELSLPLQAKLLRVIQNREFVKVGGSRPIRTDIRLITASNKDLRRAVEEGTFREDLYYRITVVMIQTPPLRERRGDIALLVDHFVAKFSAAHRKPVRGVTPRALELLTSYQWPGNVRQLENCIEQAVVLCEGDLIDVDVLWLGEAAREPQASGEGSVRIRSGLTLSEVEQQYILHTLQEAGGNRTRAARVLGISLRCLQYKLKAYAEDGAGVPGQPGRAGEPAGTHRTAEPLLGVQA
jgi:two-component system NtrC family response regulator/two-component system response regulator HydG